MATIGMNGMSLLQLAKQTGSDGRILTIAEVLNRSLGFATVPWQQGNTDGGNEYSVRSALPVIGTRAAGQGAAVTNSVVQQGIDSAVHLESPMIIDKLVYDKAGDKAKLLSNEAEAFIYAFGQAVMIEMFNGNRLQPNSVMQQRIDGFATRYNSSTTFKPVIILASNSPTNHSSIYGVTWGPQNAYGYTGNHFQAGLVQGPTQLETVWDNSTGTLTARKVYSTIFEFTFGLTIENWRQVSRYANVDYALLTKNSASGEDLIQAMIRMIRAMMDVSRGKFHYYMNRDLYTYLDLQQTYKGNALLKLEDVEGREDKVDTFRGYPVIMVDNNVIVNNEAAVS